MVDRSFIAPEYPLCKDIPKAEDNVHISEEFALELSLRNTLFPIFEQPLKEYRIMKRTSLETNALLKCRWKAYLHSIEGKKRTPFKSHPDDYHFFNYSVRFNPAETPRNRPNNRIRMRIGPGVDEYGQIPIPEEMHLRKTLHGK